MKLIEKKCPNCGAGLSFDKNDTEVVCEYCKKSYIVQRDEKKDTNYDNIDKQIISDYYNLIQKRNDGTKAVAAIVGVIIFFVVILTVSGILEIMRNPEKIIEDNKPVVETKKDNYVTEFEQIDKKSLEIFHDETQKKLNKQKDNIFSTVNASEWTYVGMYLLTTKEENPSLDKVNILYDVYKKTYVGDDFNLEVYGTVRYQNLKISDDGIVINSFNGNVYAPMIFINGGTSSWISGYESNEELFNKVIRSDMATYDVKGSEGLYVEN